MAEVWTVANPGRRELLRWLGWFGMANAVVLGIIGLRYLGGGVTGQTPLAWLYLVTIYISHYSWLALLPLLVLVTPVVLLKPSFVPVRAVAVVVMAVVIAVILLDSLLWSQSRFHINGLTLKILGTPSVVFVGVMFLIGLVFETLLAGRVWAWVGAAQAHRGRALGIFVVLCFIVAQCIYAWADASYYVPVTSVAQQLPVQRGFTAKGFLVRHGLVDISQARERRIAERVAASQERSGGLDYPLAPLQCASEAPSNLLLILVDALRSGMLGQGQTPQMDRFAQGATRFTSHYSGGNSSRMGIFSLLYGLPPGYFRSFEALQRPPVLMDELDSAGYQFGLFSSSKMYRPVSLDRTAFANVPDLRIETRPLGAPAWERDQIMSEEWYGWLDARDAERPFFGFLYYDAVNDMTYPPAYAGSVAVDPAHPMPEAFADYRTALSFDDGLIGQVLADLERRGLREDTVVIITSDHGEEFNENGDGVTGHGSGYGPHQLGVPLLVAWPGMAPGVVDHRTSHYDVVPTLLPRMLGCSNPAGDYSSGRDLFDGPQWDWLIAGSYYNYAVLEPHQITITFPSGQYEVRGWDYKLLDQPQFNGAVLEAVMRENTRFHK